MKKSERGESATNLANLRQMCGGKCTSEECEDLRKYYMNKRAMYMSSRIISVVLIELMLMITIVNSHIDAAWEGIPYAEFVIYGVIWGIAGIYLLQMMIRVVYKTYLLKLALDKQDVKKSEFEMSLKRNDNNKKLTVYARVGKKNKELWFYIDKKTHKNMVFTSNIYKSDGSGTRLISYFVNDKKNDVFFMVKDRPIDDISSKAAKRTLSDQIMMGKVKMNIIKNRLKHK